MYRNWRCGIFRVVMVLFIISIVVFEIIQSGEYFDFLFSWESGIMFSLKIIVLPVVVTCLLVSLIKWAIRGFNQPRLNWLAGIGRIGFCLLVLLIIGVFFVTLAETKSIETAIITTILFVVVLAVVILVVIWIDEAFWKSDDD